MNDNKTLSLALRMSAIQDEINTLEAQLKALKAEILKAHPEIEQGISPPFFSCSVTERVEVTDTAKAAAFFSKNRAVQPFFKITLSKDAFLKLGSPAWAGLKKSAPTIRVDQKQVAAELEARRTFQAEAENPVNALAA